MTSLRQHRRTLGGAVQNRAVQFMGSEIGTLTYSGTPVFGTSWRLSVRLRQTQIVPGRYVVDLGDGGLSLIYGFVQDCYELFMPGSRNTSGGTVRGASAPVTDMLYHTLDFVYESNRLDVYTDGVAGNTLYLPGLRPLPVADGQLVANVGGGWTGTIDYYRLQSAGTDLIHLPFNDVPGPTTPNVGTLGGVMSLNQGGLNRELA